MVDISTNEPGHPCNRTSGSPAPFLKKNIGMAYVPVESSAPGTEIRIAIRSQEPLAKIVPLPFYKRPR